jgi:hypothetical protein
MNGGPLAGKGPSGNVWRSTPLCYICELICDVFDDHGARFCDMCYRDHHLACDVDPSSAKVAEECNLMLAEDRDTGGYDTPLWMVNMSCDHRRPARRQTWLCSSCQQKQAASKTGLCYSRSNIQF